MKYYLDSCIWLNLFKEEVSFDLNKKYWEISLNFINKFFDEIYFSGIILKELEFVLNENNLFISKKDFLKFNFNFVKIFSDDYELARIYEFENNSNLSFYDYLHIAICKNNNLILITRDFEMLKFAKNVILAFKPENLLECI